LNFLRPFLLKPIKWLVRAKDILKRSLYLLFWYSVNDEPEQIQIQLMKDEAETMPDYAKTTIARKVKDHELQRIPDKTTQLFNAQNIVQQHVHMRKTERYDGGFQNTRRTGYFAQKALQKSVRDLDRERAKQSQTQTIDGVPVGDIKSVTVKTANKTIRVMR
jgi:hypothetical protein